jgi:GGDEF domain-containing protein
VLLAERMRVDVFSLPFRVSDELIRLSACFGIACSRGRSPVVVLREAETALQAARSAGPESICCFGDGAQSCDTPSSFLFPSQGDEQLAW